MGNGFTSWEVFIAGEDFAWVLSKRKAPFAEFLCFLNQKRWPEYEYGYEDRWKEMDCSGFGRADNVPLYCALQSIKDSCERLPCWEVLLEAAPRRLRVGRGT